MKLLIQKIKCFFGFHVMDEGTVHRHSAGYYDEESWIVYRCKRKHCDYIESEGI